MGRLILRSSSVASDATWLASVGLLFSDGVESAASSLLTEFPLQAGRRIWYVDANASSNGDGSESSPYWSLQEINAGSAGYTANDHIWVTGDFTEAKHNASTRQMFLNWTTISRFGSSTYPTVIRSWIGRSRAKFDPNYARDAFSAIPGADGASNGIVVINIETTRSRNPGIRIGLGGDGDIGYVRVISCWSHHNAGIDAASASSYGGIMTKAENISCDIQVRNCLTHDNTYLLDGGSLNNNTGGINHLVSNTNVAASTVVEHLYNEVYNEADGLRHKHGGVTTYIAHHNYIHDCSMSAYQIRGTNNTLHHNLVVNCARDIRMDPLNQYSARSIDEYNNTIVGTPVLFQPIDLPCDSGDTYHFHENIVSNSSQTSETFIWGAYSSSAYNIAGITAANNDLYVGSTTTFYVENGTTKSRTQFNTEFGASANVYTDPLFTNAAGGDYTLQAGSPALSVNGQRAGAF